MKNRSYICYAKRTPIGKLGGKLAHIRPDDLLATLISNFKEVQTFDMSLIDDVIIGCANQAGEDNRNIARMSSLLGGLPYQVPATTINRLCGSSMDALHIADAKIKAGIGNAFLVGGVESMTRAPYVLSKSSTPFGREAKLFDTTFGWRFPNTLMQELFPLYGMGETAEEVATLHNISRVSQDHFALESHQKAINAMISGKLEQEIIPIHIQYKKLSFNVTEDEGPRKDTSLELLSKLKAVFKKDGTVTAGNSSMMNDGASLLFICSEKFLKKHNLRPVLEVTSGAVRGVHPNIMGLGPVESTKLLLKNTSQKISDFDIVELNEAFASQSLACIKELNIDPSIVNKNGGAIALGHPLGASGTRIITTLFHQMKKNKDLKQGLATMCIGVGQGISTSFKSCL